MPDGLHPYLSAERAGPLDLMAEDVTLALRPYGIDPADAKACATVLRRIADVLSATSAVACVAAADSVVTPYAMRHEVMPR